MLILLYVYDTTLYCTMLYYTILYYTTFLQVYHVELDQELLHYIIVY